MNVTSLRPEQVLRDRYRILGILNISENISEWSIVYQARDLHFADVTVLRAIKEKINMATDDPTLREMIFCNFEREADILAMLNHPAIPRIHDYFGLGDRTYLVLEYIPGKDLKAIINSTDKLLPVERVRRWAVEICDVLSHLHNHPPGPIIYRNMKPSNVMIDHAGRVRLIGFSIAMFYWPPGRGAIVVNEGYSPPEQYRGEFSPQSDIYSLGATLHYLLTRHDPRLASPFSFDERPIQQFNPNVPEGMVAIVERALAYEPSDRFATADEMKQALEALGSGGL
jgi:serine/threonine protein kinase